ncbi:Hypothetical predicted protein [Olea europaea subsp. europaea]|uniref:Uncharacterized protein n=1 Tax=Olea europaea subsp. europaea TaxID=158383 RepID=A0A8S0RDE7_OLEEU|nr:Hypothetical predicted protein [Olea europaea subsp. europaea]
MVAAKPVSEKANRAILSESPSANKSEGFYANIEQEALELHNLSIKDNTTLSPSPEKIYTKDSISIPELNRSNIIKACNTSGVMDIKNKDDFILPEKSEVHETTPEDTIKMIAFRRAKGYKEQFEHIQKVIEEKQNIWVYKSQDHMIYSEAVAPTKQEDCHYLDTWCDHIFEGQISGTQKTKEEMFK